MLHIIFRNQFPNLTASNHTITSPDVKEYNCIAWAANEDDRWWWPGFGSMSYWPPGVSDTLHVNSFTEAFATLGYVPCQDGSLDHSFEKVVLYVDRNDIPTHMARQLSNGEWTSKLGERWDISHQTEDDLNGPTYGSAMYYYARVKSGK